MYISSFCNCFEHSVVNVSRVSLRSITFSWKYSLSFPFKYSSQKYKFEALWSLGTGSFYLESAEVRLFYNADCPTFVIFKEITQPYRDNVSHLKPQIPNQALSLVVKLFQIYTMSAHQNNLNFLKQFLVQLDMNIKMDSNDIQKDILVHFQPCKALNF